MSLRSIDTLVNLRSKYVLIRVDFNVPLKEGKIRDNTRIKAAIPTIKNLVEKEARLILMSHLGRPKGTRKIEFSLLPVYKELCSLLEKEGIRSKVGFSEDICGPEAEEKKSQLNDGDILLLENLRFHPEETANDASFAQKLASLADIYVNDAFGTVHRAHASTEAVARILPSYAGLLVQKEHSFFSNLLRDPKKPLAAVVGGSKVSSKIMVLENLLDCTDVFVIGGGMAYTFLSAQGHQIGSSLFEKEYVQAAKRFLERAEEENKRVLLPQDHVCAEQFSPEAKPIVVDTVDIPEGYIAMDIGSRSIQQYREELSKANTIIWNGPMGVFEFAAFSTGTKEIAQAIGDSSAHSVVGGGDSVAAINAFDLCGQFSHVSTGGGASLEFLEGKSLPGIEVLS